MSEIAIKPCVQTLQMRLTGSSSIGPEEEFELRVSFTKDLKFPIIGLMCYVLQYS